ncbi:hypothetical protein IV203_006617 [Nitzschia inconspicua]|uniref:Uncharacterized protein n=1 Tax=Nitzschia inconspicua TaxID=303405 RepID=A0A9K3K8Y1_9STRA|nr:hypothetical protein IV203_006617 [Nitzschia inconspicua]
MATVEESSSSTGNHRRQQQQQRSQTMSHDKVIFQKVVRPPPGLPDVSFLGYLVEYLEHHFELPSAKLSMVYETQLMDDDGPDDIVDVMEPDEQQSTAKKQNRCLLAWDSPLSPSSEATRMELEVVGVYTSAKDKNRKKDKIASPSVPNMAMVVVRKANIPHGNAATIPPMMQNLFRDSEEKILKALDRGLEDLVAGKIKLKDFFREQRSDAEQQREKANIPNFRTAEEVIEAELVEESKQRKTRDGARASAEDVVFDAYATTDWGAETKNDVETTAKISLDRKTRRPANENDRAKAIATMKVSIGYQPSNTKSSSPDFAVEAAKRVAQRRKTKTTPMAEKSIPEVSTKNEDFAVTAARTAAKLRKEAGKKVPASKTKSRVRTSAEDTLSGQPSRQTMKVDDSQPVLTNEDSKPETMSATNWQARDHYKDIRKFRTVVSTPESRAARLAQRKAKTGPTEVDTKPTTPSLQQETENPKIESTTVKPAKDEDVKGNRNINVKINDDPDNGEASNKDSPDVPQKDLDAFNKANEVLDEIAKQGQDMTAEDMLRQILKFDEEQKKEEQVGSGFASGAFEEAKELLKVKQQQQESKGRTVGFKELDKEKSQFSKAPTVEEELKAMFAAGQQLADGKITERVTNNNPGGMGRTQTSEKDVDDLISRDRSISSYARSLDRELAELEVCINQSPGEELDPQISSPIFDIMSGPETYNPNVDLDTVNYPGAQPGTKQVNLPKELDEAIKQAEFAAGVLEKIQTVETKNSDGETSFRYYSGKAELTAQQVADLQNVVMQASQIGIISDPVVLMAERSRLEIILREMWDQPEERYEEIASNFKDLLLSNNFVRLVRERLRDMANRDLEALRRDDESLKKDHEKEREILGKLVEYAQALLKQARALGAELEAQQLEIVRSICKVAMDPSHTSEEETAIALSDAVRDMRPLLDDAFVAYLKYAVAEEEAKLARQGVLDDPDYNQWLFVLKIVQQGVYAEIAKGINRYIEHIWYVLRMETPRQRRALLEMLIDDMPTMDVRPFVQVVDNIVGSLGDSVKGDFDGVVPLGEMTNKLLQLHRDVKDLLPPERIALKSKDADEWAARQKKRLLEQQMVKLNVLTNNKGTFPLYKSLWSIPKWKLLVGTHYYY